MDRSDQVSNSRQYPGIRAVREPAEEIAAESSGADWIAEVLENQLRLTRRISSLLGHDEKRYR